MRLGALLFEVYFTPYWRVFMYLHRATGSASVHIFLAITGIAVINLIAVPVVGRNMLGRPGGEGGASWRGIGQTSSRCLLLRGFLEEVVKVWPTLVF